jgi:hypothetical protein
MRKSNVATPYGSADPEGWGQLVERKPGVSTVAGGLKM